MNNIFMRGEDAALSAGQVDHNVSYLRAALKAAYPVRSLWADGQDGLWWDIQDLSTMFQDSNGLNPVTSPEQPVGLVLDKHLGLIRGDELSLDAQAPLASTYGWVGSGSDLTINEGKIRATLTTNSGGGQLYREISGLTVGRLYEYVAKVRCPTGARCASWNGTTMGNVPFPPGTTTIRIMFIAEAATIRPRIYIGQYASGNNIGDFADLESQSLKEIPGHHIYQPTSTARAKLKAYPHKLGTEMAPALNSDAWLLGAGWGMNGEKLVRSAGTSGSTASFSASLQPGKKYYYKLVVDSLVMSGAAPNIRLLGGTRVDSPPIEAAGTYEGVLVAAAGNTAVHIATPASQDTLEISLFHFAELTEAKYYLQPDGVDDFYYVSGSVDLRDALIGFAVGKFTKTSVALSSAVSGYLVGSTGAGGHWSRNAGGTMNVGIPAKDRQSVIFQTSKTSTAFTVSDSSGASVTTTGGTGLNGQLFFGAYNATPGNPANCPFYGFIARTGPSTAKERQQILDYLDSCLGEVSP